MKAYGDVIPFQQKKSGWYPYTTGRPRKEDAKRSWRWFKRLGRRLNQIMIQEEQREKDPGKIHV
jgi:hypothetical protein